MLNALETGAGRPLSILNSAALITITKESTGNGGTILYGNLVRMLARMLPSSRQRSIWVCSNTTIPVLMKLFVTDGTIGPHVPVLTGGNGRYEMFFRPVLFTEKLPTLGTKGDVMLIDPSQYAIGMPTNIDLAVSPHVKFTTDELMFRLRV